MQNSDESQSRKNQTLWICLTIGVVGFIGIGMSMADEDDCKGFLGVKDNQCVIEKGLRAADRLLALPIR